MGVAIKQPAAPAEPAEPEKVSEESYSYYSYYEEESEEEEVAERPIIQPKIETPPFKYDASPEMGEMVYKLER